MAYTITLKQGNLLEEDGSDFIVNPSNTRFLLGSGVSMAFRNYFGNTLEIEMQEALQASAQTPKQGEVILTTPKKSAAFKYILHVAVMNYSEGAEKIAPTLKVIEDALSSIEHYLFEYAKKSSKKVKLTLPLMGCGVGGLNKREVIHIYKEFFSKKVPYECEVVIYAHSIEDYKLLQELFS